jgi:chromosome segregation ATPase
MQSLDTEAEEEQVDQIVMRQVTLGAVEDDLQMRRSELAELETEIRLGKRRLDELEGLATEGERIIEDQSLKASAAMKDLEWMEAELGRLSAEIVEVTARLDEKSLMLREAEALVSRSKRQAEELEGQRRLLEELERHNAATLDESRRLGRELDGLRQQKQEISFSLEPALMDALEELERSKAFARNLAGERGKAAQLELALEGEEENGVERSTTTASGAATGVDGTPNLLETAGDLVHRLECERLASLKRTTALAEGTSWRRWRPTQIKAFRRNAAAC